MPLPSDHADVPALSDLKASVTASLLSPAPSDAVLQNNLNWAIGTYENWIGRSLAPVSVTFALACRGQRKVPLPREVSAISSVTVLQNLMVQGQDYDLMSVTGQAPWQWIEFTMPLPQRGFANGGTNARVGLVIVATDGAATVRDDDWQAVLALALIMTLPGVAMGTSLGRARVEMGSFSEYFNMRGDGGPYDNERKVLWGLVQQTALARRRWAVV